MPARQRMLTSQLLVWLLLPLTLLLIADAYVSYRVALGFARAAYDRSLIEVAHEIALHLRLDGGKLALDLPEPAYRVLLNDPVDRIYYSITSADGVPIAGERLPGARDAVDRGPRAESLYDGRINGDAVRVVELRVERDTARGHPGAIVRVAETEGKRKELAREILLSVV